MLRENPRGVYWAGDEIEVDWIKAGQPWVFLWTLAQHQRDGKPLDRLALDPSGRRRDTYITKLKSRLVRLDGFPPDLAELIEAEGCRTYRLRLSPDRIRLFHCNTDGDLQEWRP